MSARSGEVKEGGGRRGGGGGGGRRGGGGGRGGGTVDKVMKGELEYCMEEAIPNLGIVGD